MNKLLWVFVFLVSFKHYSQASDFKHIDFEKADAVAKQLEGASLENLPILVHSLTSNLDTDVEKFRAIYIWVCSNIDNDYGNHLLNLKKRRKFKNDSVALYNWNAQFKKKALKNLIKHKKTICTGYAYLLQELSSLAGLNCKMIHGYGRTVSSNIGELSIPNHSWNAIELNGKWYLSDPTWASGYFNIDESAFERQYNNGYFLSSPDLFVKSHYPLEPKWILTENSISIDDFLTGPLVYGNTFKYGVIPLDPVKMNTKISVDEELIFKYYIPRKKVQDTIVMNINGSDKEINRHSFYNETDQILTYRYTFPRKGVFDVHLKLNDDVVSTHSIKVQKVK